MSHLVRFAVFVLLPSIAGAQVSANFSPGPRDSRVPGVTLWAVEVCNRTLEPASVPGGQLYDAVLGHFVWIAPAAVRELANRKHRSSVPHKLVVASELAAAGATAALAVEALKIRERAKAMFPAGLGILELGRQRLIREHPVWELPANTLDRWIGLPGHGCTAVIIFGKSQVPEVPFLAQLPQ